MIDKWRPGLGYGAFPFRPYWKDKMLSGQKTCTSRPSRYFFKDNKFMAFGAIFELIKVERLSLEHVATVLYKDEGCDSPDAFIAVWNDIHHIKGYVPEQVVWVHHFRLVKGAL